ncbi:MAG: glycosyltransferase [Planctomycetes bacterium]|nr:glycosyltransferase [Planctomycetota bacterium]
MIKITHATSVDVLFLCEKPLWPRDQGFRVHGSQMALALSRQGLNVAIACMEANPTDTDADLRRMIVDWPRATDQESAEFRANWTGSRPGTWLRNRIADHQGLAVEQLAGALSLTRRLRPRAVVGVGMHSVLMLRGLPVEIEGRPLQRVWYAADELVYFNLTCLPHESFRALPGRLRTTVLHLALERAFAPGIDAAIAVSPRDATLLRRIAGVPRAITVRNGVDLDAFTPTADDATPLPHSLVFWGRMDFEPNIDAATWFAREVWPLLRERHRDATWSVVGKNPGPRVTELNNEPGINVVGGVADIHPWARRAAVTILPMRCGGGIKNKLLEAAALARPIVASPRAVRGLELGDNPPMILARKAAQWIEAIDALWTSPTTAAVMGGQARVWVERYHNWGTAASQLVAALGLPITDRGDQTRGGVLPINTAQEERATRRAA